MAKSTSIEERRYVVGFPFNTEKTQVALIRRTKPDWQKGKLNGWGGHIEDDDQDPFRAMLREFSEETGGIIAPWTYRGLVVGWRFRLWVYSCITDLSALPEKTDVDMPVEIWSLDTLFASMHRHGFTGAIPNLKYLIPMSLDENVTATIIDTYTP